MDEHKFENAKMSDELFNQNWENTIKHLEAKNEEAMKKEWEWAESPYANLLLLLNLGINTPHQLFALFLDKLNVPLDMRNVIESYPILYNAILRRVEYMIRRSLPSPGKTRPGDVDEAFGMTSALLYTSARQTGKSMMNLHVQSSAEAILTFIFKGANMDVNEMVRVRDKFYANYPDPLREGRHSRGVKVKNSSLSGSFTPPSISRRGYFPGAFNRLEELDGTINTIFGEGYPVEDDGEGSINVHKRGNEAKPSSLIQTLIKRI